MQTCSSHAKVPEVSDRDAQPHAEPRVHLRGGGYSAAVASHTPRHCPPRVVECGWRCSVSVTRGRDDKVDLEQGRPRPGRGPRAHVWSAIALPSARGAMPAAPLCLPRMPPRTRRRRRRRAARRVRAQRPSSLCQHPVSSQVKLCCFPLRSLRWASGCRAQLATERTAAAAPRGPARRIRRCRPVSQVHDFSHFSHSFCLRPFPIKFCKFLLV